jgi:hypothetical protein
MQKKRAILGSLFGPGRELLIQQWQIGAAFEGDPGDIE